MRSKTPRAGTPGRSPDLLFTYGTLMRGFRLNRLLAGRAAYVTRGQVRARLVDLGSYPGAVPDAGAALHGEVYRISDPALWAVLDSAEGPQYHRRVVTVRSEDGHELGASIYWYIGPLDRGVPIPGGDYRAHAPATSIYHQSP
ncbi:MAG TPA: gamma-glutamylcyclotransferase family protein [Candidatus Limnocylindria bacterium]|nr:gamma-glutamylcyclotransferase family protein [Candidatus Limnocylindria bacterium]